MKNVSLAPSLETYAYDCDTDTKTTCRVDESGGVWTPFIVLTLDDPINCEKIRFWAWYDEEYPLYPHCDAIDIDVYYNSGWHHVYQGSFADREWVEKPCEHSGITKARVSFHVNRQF